MLKAKNINGSLWRPVKRAASRLFDSPRDLGTRLLGVFPRLKRQCDERSFLAPTGGNGRSLNRALGTKERRNNLQRGQCNGDHGPIENNSSQYCD
jgi:hypothetical protein